MFTYIIIIINVIFHIIVIRLTRLRGPRTLLYGSSSLWETLLYF